MVPTGPPLPTAEFKEQPVPALTRRHTTQDSVSNLPPLKGRKSSHGKQPVSFLHLRWQLNQAKETDLSNYVQQKI